MRAAVEGADVPEAEGKGLLASEGQECEQRLYIPPLGRRQSVPALPSYGLYGQRKYNYSQVPIRDRSELRCGYSDVRNIDRLRNHDLMTRINVDSVRPVADSFSSPSSKFRPYSLLSTSATNQSGTPGGLHSGVDGGWAELVDVEGAEKSVRESVLAQVQLPRSTRVDAALDNCTWI